jgi:hypothetical protein
MGSAYVPLVRGKEDEVVQVKTPPVAEPQVHPVPPAEYRLSELGRLSVTVRGPIASDGPRFSTLTV